MNTKAGAAALLVLAFAAPAVAQEAGWSYSPLDGEGDRAAMGCAADPSPTNFTCLAVRCEDDGRLGIYVYADRPERFLGTWNLEVDKATYPVHGLPRWMSRPYSSRLADTPPRPIADLVEDLIAGGVAYLEGKDGAAVPLSLSGTTRWVGGVQIACEPRRR